MNVARNPAWQALKREKEGQGRRTQQPSAGGKGKKPDPPPEPPERSTALTTTLF